MNTQPFSPVRNIKLIYRFHENVERRLRLSGYSYRKNFDFTQTRRYNAKLHDTNGKKNGTPLFWIEVTFEWFEFAMVFCVFIFIFMFRSNVIREQLGQNNFRRCYGFFSRKYHFESTWSQRCSLSSFLSTITKHLDNGIWKTPYNWRFYGHRCQACSKTFNLLLHASLSLQQAQFLNLT